MVNFRFLKILFLLLLINFKAYSFVGDWQESVQNVDALQIRVLQSFYENENGEKKLILGVHLKMRNGWKIYSKGSESVGLVPEIEFLDLKNYQNHQILWPQAIFVQERIGDIKLNYAIYEDEVILPIEVDLSKIEEGSQFKINVNYGICKEICIPATSTFDLILQDEIDDEALNLIQEFLPNYEETQNSIKKSQKIGSITLFYGLFAAFLGGLILNIMPCVLPVLAVKLMSIINHQDSKISRIKFAYISTFFGILFSFTVFAVFAVVLGKAGRVFNWGMQFQNPYFLIFLILILLFFAANMLGFFEISFNRFLANSLNKKIDKSKDRSVFIPNFLSGILAVLLATPCSAPFLGAAISFSITQSPIIIFAIFLTMGFGFALPYVLLTIFPKAVYLLPKSGSWMILVKKIMAILLFITIIWLIYVLSGNIGFYSSSLIAIISILILLVFKIKYKFIQYILFLAFIILAFCLPLKIKNYDKITKYQADRIFIEFDEEKIDEYINQGKVVFIDVTADWCLTCKFNKYRVLYDKSVIQRLEQDDIVAMRADITKPNLKVMAFINSHNRYAIPFNVIYGANAKNGLLTSELLSKKELFELINKAKK